MRAVVTLCVWTLCAVAVAAQNRARFADVELVGPVRGVVLTIPGGGETRIEGELERGETRVVSVPVPAQASTNAPPLVSFDEPLALDETPGRARFLGWRGGLSPLADLSPGLRARARPALEETPLAISSAALVVLLTALVVTLALKRRPWLALVAGVVASAALYPLVAKPAEVGAARVTLIDGDTAQDSWRRIDAARDEIVVPRDVHEFELWTEPADALVTWFAPLANENEWRARARGARLFLASRCAGAGLTLARTGNGYAPLDSVWLREEGEWRASSAWELDAPLPQGRPAGAPPGWLASHLPQGVPILIARECGGPARTARWIRLSGL
ncbi:MAG: hypothetical protein JNL28_17710 [Planctomycetes bacterium]|nr:hypothetical protein [Planctomycetota bacterium]